VSDHLEIGGSIVGQTRVFHVTPHVVHGIQFRSVWGEFFDHNCAVLVQKTADGSCPVNRDFIPQESDGARYFSPQIVEEGNQRWPSEIGVVWQKVKIEAESLVMRAD
jgi:hypothetical protein